MNNLAAQQTSAADRKRKYVRDRSRHSFSQVGLPTSVNEPLVGFDQATKALDLRARSSIYKLVKKGLLTPRKVLGATKFSAAEIRALQAGD